MSMNKNLRIALFSGTMILALCAPASAEEKVLHIMDAGGDYGNALTKCIEEPLLADKGIKVVRETPGGYAKVVAQVKSGTVVNVATDAGTSEFSRLVADGLVEKIDWVKFNPEPMFDEAKKEYGYGSSYYSTIMAYRADAKAPANWVDFFDTVGFPGKRALPDYADYVLPFAAIAGGQDVATLSNGVDLDKAFATLNRVKADTIWWQAGAQPPQLLQDNEVQYAIAWSGRVVGKDGVKVNWQDGNLDLSYYAIVKGASEEQKDMVYEWFRYQTNAKRQACMLKYISYPGSSPDLEKLVPAAKLAELPTYGENKKIQWLTNGAWWLQNATEIEKRWNEFKLKQ